MEGSGRAWKVKEWCGVELTKEDEHAIFKLSTRTIFTEKEIEPVWKFVKSTSTPNVYFTVWYLLGKAASYNVSPETFLIYS